MKGKRHRLAAISACFSTRVPPLYRRRLACMLLLVLSPVLPNFPVFAEAPPTEAAGGLLIDTTGWDDLSREVIPRVLESSLDMGTLLRYAKSASCTVDVAIKTPQISMPELGSFVIPAGPPSTARATLSWEDANDDGTVTEEEVKVETGYTSDIMIKLAMERAEKELRNLVVLNIVNLLPQSSVKAEKKGQEYEITVNPKKGPPVPMRLTVSADSRITHMEFRTLGAVDTKATLKHVQKAGKWLLTETETTTSSGAPQPSSDKWSIEFRMEGAIPLLARIGMISTSSTGGGTLRTEQEYAFGNWRVVKREQPMEVVVAPVKTEGPLAEPRRTVPAVTEGPSPRVNIPRTEQANNLARDTLFSVGNAYYDLSAVGVTGYEATFALQRDGRMVGSFKLKWEAFGSISIEPEEGQAEEMRGLAEALGRQVGGVVAGGPLSNYSLAADAYAARSADQTVIDATKHAVASDPNVKSDLVFVSPDLQQIRATRTMNDGRTSQISYAGEEFEGKLFVSSTTDTVSDPGATPQRTEYTWTYTKKYGEPFVRSLKWSGTAAGLAGDWAMLLQSIAFQKEVARIRIDAGPAERAKLAREVRVPHTEEANKLAQQVLEAVQKKVYGLKSTGVTGFEATYGVQLGGKEAGTLKATCNLGRPLTATASLEELPGEPTKEQVEAIKNTAELHCRTVMTTLLDVGAAAPDPGAYAIKSGNEYVVDFLEQASKGGVDAAVAIAYLPEGLTGYREIFIAKNGTIIEQSWHVEPREGEFVVTSFTWTTLSPGSEPHRNDFTLAYARKDGELFVSRFETEESMGGRKVPWIGVLKDVTFKRETLAASETEAGADVEIPRNTQTMKCGSGVYDKLAASYYNLSADTDVVAFDAVYALGLGDEPLGTMNVTWDGRKTFSESITVPFPFLASRIQVTFKLLAEAAVADDTAKTIKHLGEGVFSVVAERSFPFAANVYGVKSEGQTTIDVTEFYGLNPLVKKSITYASEDLCKIRNVMSYDDGGVTETVFQGELVEKKHFMSKVTLNKAGTDSPKLEYALTYTPKEGVPFVETAVLETTRAGRRTFLRAELQKVTFGRKERTPETGPPDEPTTTTEPQVTTRVATVEEARKLARETKVPRTQEAKQLASQVLTSIQKQYYSVFHSTSVSGFQVTASVKKDDYDVGDIKITWKRDDPENVDSKPEKKVEDPVTIAIHGMAMELAAIDALMPFVLGPLTSPQAPEGHAVKSGGLCIIDLTEATNSDNLESRLLCVPQDFRRVQEIRSYKDGDVLEWIFNGEAADRMLLIGSATQPMSGPLGGDYQPTNFTWTYTRKGGGIFIKKVVVDQPLMGSVLHWTIQFGDVTFQGGGNVPDIPKDIQNAREPALKNLEEQTRKALEEAMAGQGKWECVVCGYIYDAKKGDPEGDVEPDTPFEDLEDDWTCPDCGGAKDGFEQAD